MSNQIEIKAAIPCSDDQRESARVMAKLEDSVAAVEEAIHATTGHVVKIDMRVVRRKDAKGDAPVVPTIPVRGVVQQVGGVVGRDHPAAAE